MLKYTRWIASSTPIESSPPFRMWCTVSGARARSQHFPSRPGSHQHFVSAAGVAGQAVTLRHLITSSPSNCGRWWKLWMALMVPGFETWSVGIAEVSDVPGRACAYIWYSSES